MERRFNRITNIEEYISKLSVSRTITNIQIHHTYAPTLFGYNMAKSKEGVIRAMYIYHTKTRGFRDIAQHFSVAPDGVWDGRTMEWDSGGFLGYENIGGVCIEIIGNFDKEAFDGPTAQYTYRLVRALLNRWPTADIRFHRDQPSAKGKTCPGKNIQKTSFESAVRGVSACDVLHGLGVAFDVKGWNIKARANPALKSVLDAIADNWIALNRVPYMGDLLIKIGNKMKL